MNQFRSLVLTELSLRDALDLAILIEEEAKDRYEEFAHQMLTHHNADAERFFWRMVQVELTHERKLTFRRRKLFHDETRRVTREMIFDVEAPDYDEARATMTVRQALEAALRGEEKAYRFFDLALARVDDPLVRELFTELRAEELEHKELVEKELAKLPPEPMIGMEDVSDDPVAL